MDIAGTHRPNLGTRFMIVLWPAFLMAGVLAMLVFALIDPHQMQGWGMDFLAWSPNAVYTMVFFLFWGVIAMASAISLWLAAPGPPPQAGRNG